MSHKEKDIPEEIGEVAGDEAPRTAVPGGEEPLPGEGEELARQKERFMYLAAEFDNYRKRAAREKADLVAYGNERLLSAILPSLDNLERAMSQAGTSDAAKPLLDGIRLTYDQLLAELRKFGLEQIAAEGKMFDPRFHEALARVPWEGSPEGTILAEARKGYLLNGRLLRPSQVTVAQAPPAPGPDGTDSQEEPSERES